MRPKIISEINGTKCWHTDPLKRHDTDTLWKKMGEIKSYYYQNNLIEMSYLS
jgi:hypothetical protein